MNLITLEKTNNRSLIALYDNMDFCGYSDYTCNNGKSGSIAFYAEEKFKGTEIPYVIR